MNTQGLFTYGTLMLDDVIGALLNRVPRSFAATLSDHRRVYVKDQVFPAIYACPDAETQGRFFQDIRSHEWAILDWFESDLYERVELEVTPLKDKGSRYKAWTYRVESKNLSALDDHAPWILDHFIREHAEDYIQMCKGCPEHFHQVSLDSNEENL